MKIKTGIWKRTEIIVAQMYVGILTWLSNLQYSDIDGNDTDAFRQRVLRGLSPNRCSSSSITHLRIKIHSSDDCLCRLDGRLSQLHTLIVKLDSIRDSNIVITDQV